MYSKDSIEKFRNYYIAMSNEFAQNSCYSYTLFSHRLFCYILAKIPSYDGKTSNKPDHIDVDLGHVIAVFNLPSSGTTYSKLRLSISQLLLDPVYMNEPFLDQAEQISKTIYRVRINVNLENHFFGLRAFVKFQLLSVIPFGSIFSFQIHALLLSRFRKSEHYIKIANGSIRGYIGNYSYSPEHILNMLNLTQPSYKVYKNFNSAVLKKAKNEINLYSDIDIDYQGNNLVIIFSVKHKSSDDVLRAYANILTKLQ